MAQQRSYSWEFKLQMVQLLEQGEQNPYLVKGLQVEAPNRLTSGGPDLCAAARGLCVSGLSAGCLFAHI
jgi:hypothetical protein